MRIDPRMLAIARGDEAADVLLSGGRVVNVFTGEVGEANVAICFCDEGEQGSRRGRIAGVGGYGRAAEVVDVSGLAIAPGFIDAHMHVESTMLPVREFVRLAAPHGTTGVVLDPHEIANVLGIAGIRWIMDDARGLPLHAMFALSSCVPASPLETSGARLEAADLAPLFDDERVVALAEMMNFPGVVRGSADVLAKVELGLARRIVDGHAPGLSGAALQAYVAAGITSDHECTTAAEAMEKLRLGMQIFIREGSAARNLAALAPVVTEANRHRFCFCTDDRHPADLAEEGHIDHVVRLAIARGLAPATALAMASLHVARHYRVRDRGAVTPGHLADLVVIDDLAEPRARMVMFEGRVVGRDGAYVGPAVGECAAPPASAVRLPAGFSADSLRVKATSAGAMIRVIGMHAHQLVTECLTMPAKTVGGEHVADVSRDVLKLAVIERHRGSGTIGLGFVKGLGLREGAVASTVGHDSHNLAVAGTNDADMCAAARALAEVGGGQCVVKGGAVVALLPLPIAGLMSDRPAAEVIGRQRELLRAMRGLGCPHQDPFMPLSFLPLAVIPHLKLTDRGLVDVDRFELVGVEV